MGEARARGGGEGGWVRGRCGGERECVMCMFSDEVAVGVPPCSHQGWSVGPCPDALEAQGMRDCPSCRTAIESRIKVFWPRR